MGKTLEQQVVQLEKRVAELEQTAQRQELDISKIVILQYLIVLKRQSKEDLY